MAINEVSPSTAKALMESEEPILLLDVRTREEYALAHIEGSVLLPMHELGQRIEELDPEHPVIVMCHHGMRSLQVALYLNNLEFAQVSNLSDGIDRWSIEVDTSIPRY